MNPKPDLTHLLRKRALMHGTVAQFPFERLLELTF